MIRLRGTPAAARAAKALLYGRWDLFEGQYFESSPGHSFASPPPIPNWWCRYSAIDYGLDMLPLWIALAPMVLVWVYPGGLSIGADYL